MPALRIKLYTFQRLEELYALHLFWLCSTTRSPVQAPKSPLAQHRHEVSKAGLRWRPLRYGRRRLLHRSRIEKLSPPCSPLWRHCPGTLKKVAILLRHTSVLQPLIKRIQTKVHKITRSLTQGGDHQALQSRHHLPGRPEVFVTSLHDMPATQVGPALTIYPRRRGHRRSKISLTVLRQQRI